MIIKITKEIAQRIREGRYYLTYNPSTNSYRVVKASKRDIAHYVGENELEYYTFIERKK